MAIDPQKIALFARLAMSAYPQILKTFNREGGLTNFPNAINALVNKGYDPGLMQETFTNVGKWAAPDKTPSIFDNIYSRTAPDSIVANSVSDSEELVNSITDSPEINPHEPKLNLLMEDLLTMQKEPGYPSSAAQSAIAMLQNNPQIGTANDPDMLLHQNIWEGLPAEAYESAPRMSGDLYGNSAFSASDLFDDDDPMNAKAKIFKKLTGGR